MRFLRVILRPFIFRRPMGVILNPLQRVRDLA